MSVYEKIGDLNFFTNYKGDIHFITVTSDTSQVNDSESLKKAFQFIADYCKEHNIAIIHERIFASKGMYNNIFQIRQRAYSEKDICCSSFTYVNSNTLYDESLAGINIYGVSLLDQKPKDIYYKDKQVGFKWSNKDMDLISLHSLHDDKITNSPYQQTKNYFNLANEILMAEGFSFHDVCRTWIYLNNILDQYDSFNLARNEVFSKLGLLQEQHDINKIKEIYLPASTGINGENIFNASGIMDVFAVRPKHSKLKIFNESGKLQNSAFQYGSAFSRSIIIDDDRNKQRQLFLSGTASIDKSGKSVYLNDIDKQIKMTFDVIDQLLKINNVTLYDISEGTIFLKKASYVQNFKSYCWKNNMPPMPLVIVVSDVCRDDLLFEIDSTFMTDIK